ncbi:MAG: hypothetical protein LBK46_04360, partial [Oscillospiraceae bacterium]|nr:hypothetical protein [Oscillospiraceae bacterium]
MLKRHIEHVKRFVYLYAAFAKISVRSNMTYRGAFWAGFVGQWLYYGSSFITLFIIVNNFDTLAGWST